MVSFECSWSFDASPSVWLLPGMILELSSVSGLVAHRSLSASLERAGSSGSTRWKDIGEEDTLPSTRWEEYNSLLAMMKAQRCRRIVDGGWNVQKKCFLY